MTTTREGGEELQVLEAGSATVDITPKDPVYLGGYGAGPVRKCTQLSSPIYARSLLLREGQKSIAFLVLDTQGIPYQSRRSWFGFRAIEEKAKSQVPDLEVVFGASSHSHCSPDSTGLWGGLDDDYARSLIEGAVSAVAEASSRTTPCEIYFGCVRTENLIRSQVRTPPHDRVEDRAFVIEARSAPGKAIGRLVIFAAHPTVASGNHLTSDWPGEIADSLDKDPGGTTLVLPGCIGRTQPKFKGDGSQRSVRAYASLFEEQLRPLLSRLAPLQRRTPEAPVIDATEAFVDHPVRNVAMLAAARALGRFDSAPTRGEAAKTSGARTVGARTVSKVVRIGDIYLFGFPGEAYPNLQWAIEDEFASGEKDSIPIVCSLVGDQIGYLIYPPSTYTALAMRAAWNDNALLCVAPGAGSRLLHTALRLAGELSTSAPRQSPQTEGSEPSLIWDAVGIPGSAVAAALTIAGVTGYGVASLGKAIAKGIVERVEQTRRSIADASLRQETIR